LASLVLLALLIGPAVADLRLVEEAVLTQGIVCGGGYISVFDTDHDLAQELLFCTFFRGNNRQGLAFYERAPDGSYGLVYADTTGSQSRGIDPAALFPFAAGYLDQDGLTDLIGTNGECLGDTVYLIVCQHEALSHNTYPETLVWYGRYAQNCAQSERVYLTDLDQDGRREILFSREGTEVRVYENNGDNSCRLVATAPGMSGLSCFAVGDFDQDGRTEFASAGIGWHNHVWMWKCIGNDEYVLYGSHGIELPNGHDIFEGDDCDGNGKPEFFVGFAAIQKDGWNMYLYQFEDNGAGGYDTFRIATGVCGTDWWWGRQSKCGDVDGDGIPEVVWSLSTSLRVLKGVGPHQYEQAGYWWNHGANDLSVNIADVNNDGYNEIICSGSNYTYVLGLEAVKVKYPNGGETFRGNDTARIRWQRYEPPRCDSVSLFFSMDNGMTYDTVAAGLAPSDTSYPWVVPDVRSDSCLVKAVVYGPGWRQDVSDAVFRILSSGVAEERVSPRKSFGLVVCPNPMSNETYISFGPTQAGNLSLRIFEASGRLVRDLSAETGGRGCVRWNRTDANGRTVPQGVYLVQFCSEGRSVTRKVVVK